MIDVPTPETMYMSELTSTEGQGNVSGFFYAGGATGGTVITIPTDLVPPGSADDYPVLLGGAMGTQAVLYPNGYPLKSIFVYDGHAYICGGTWHTLSTPHLTSPWTVYKIVKDELGTDEEHYTYREMFTLPSQPSSFATMTGIKSDGEIGDILFIGSLNTGIVYTWDGKLLQTEFDANSLTRQLVVFGLDDIWVFGTEYGWKRENRQWLAVTGLPTGFMPTCGAEYQDRILVGGLQATDGIVVIDKTRAVLVQHVPVTSPPSASITYHGCYELQMFSGVMTYLWRNWDGFATPYGNQGKIGYYDGSAFHDDQVTFRHLGAGIEGPGSVGTFVNGDKLLYVSSNFSLVDFVDLPGPTGIYGISDVFSQYDADTGDVLADYSGLPTVMVMP
jgi:hypothetical protein